MQDTLSELNQHNAKMPSWKREPGQWIPMDILWRSLVSAEIKIKRTQHGLGRCFVIVGEPSAARPPSPTAVRVAERVLAGEQPKVVAAALAISQTTVCQYCRSVLEMFSDSWPMSRASTFAVMGACAAQGLPIVAAWVHGLNQEGDAVLSVELPDAPLERAGLSAAERSIAWARIQGKTAAQIGAERKTSPRTIANQLNAIHRKLRVSGRRELLVAILTYAEQSRYSDYSGSSYPGSVLALTPTSITIMPQSFHAEPMRRTLGPSGLEYVRGALDGM